MVRVINAYAARLAQRVGFRALYLSGGGGVGCVLRDAGPRGVSADDVLPHLRRITAVTDLPVLVDGGEPGVGE